MKTTTLAASAAMLVGCATTVDDRYDFIHPTNTVEQKNQDIALCATSWLNSPLIAEYARQIQAGVKEDKDLGGWAGGYGVNERAAKRRRNAAELQHVTACMGAIGYKRLWFDEHSPRGRPYRDEVPKI